MKGFRGMKEVLGYATVISLSPATTCKLVTRIRPLGETHTRPTVIFLSPTTTFAPAMSATLWGVSCWCQDMCLKMTGLDIFKKLKTKQKGIQKKKYVMLEGYEAVTHNFVHIFTRI